MNLHILLPEITEIDKRLKSVKQLANYDPLVSLIRDRFSDKITHHLSSLKAGKQKAFAGKDRPENNSYDEMKDFYLGLGKERAVVELMFDMAGQMLSSTSIRLLAEILLGEDVARDRAPERRDNHRVHRKNRCPVGVADFTPTLFPHNSFIWTMACLGKQALYFHLFLLGKRTTPSVLVSAPTTTIYSGIMIRISIYCIRRVRASTF